MREFGCQSDTTSSNIVIWMFCEKGDVDLVLGFCQVGCLEDACVLVKLMHDQGCVPNVVAYSALLDGFCKIRDFDKALELLGEMEKEENGGMPNVVRSNGVTRVFP
ncbi:hypothetical protein IFM89_008368 [Coptis chinensis]|uniref:Pentatricopeptide repeat-containing protein n=1 Tax=Coptis chinensis TaxID=261450 RepID=A0A835MDF2_9MAGN|nr:hypothetical protein IFM89_008368 [Coptis chinensis]